MSEASFTSLGARSAIEADTADLSEDNGEAMDVETAPGSETKPGDVGRHDQSWMAHGPFNGPQEDVVNDMPVPASNSVMVESDVLASKSHDELVKMLGDLMSKVTHLTDRVSALEAVANNGMSSASSQPHPSRQLQLRCHKRTQ